MGRLNVNDILNDPDGFVNNTPILEKAKSFTSDADIKKAANKLKQQDTVEKRVIESTLEQRKFANSVLYPLAKALNSFNARSKEDYELFIAVAVDPAGELVVANSGLAPQGGSFAAPADTVFVMHWHHKALSDIPDRGDHQSVKRRAISGFVGTYNDRGFCCTLFEVGQQFDKKRKEYRFKYRQIKKDSTVKDWTERKRANDWN